MNEAFESIRNLLDLLENESDPEKSITLYHKILSHLREAVADKLVEDFKRYAKERNRRCNI